MQPDTVRIGGASGFWGDASRATPQLLAGGNLDFIVYDYLAEITMSIMARARAEDGNSGYARDFVSVAMADNLDEIARQGVRIVANAGGVNPRACAAALEALIGERSLNLAVACVTGDDLLDRAAGLAGEGIVEMFSGESFPSAERVQSINAYFGAFPIARALDLGADIVITGRCVDSAVTLGACIHSFGWPADAWDRLAAGSLAGHILECGPQATGGNFTDWQLVADEIDRLGYPVAEVGADGRVVCTKPVDTGGLVSIGTVAEQMLYEIGDPQDYVLPDVRCDFSNVSLGEAGKDRVELTGATGRPPADTYKVCATYLDEFRGGTLMTYYGIDAHAKALAQSSAIFRASRQTLRDLGMPDFSATSVEVIGAEGHYGKFRKVDGSREVVVKVAAKHADPKGIGVLLKETVGLGLATPPGLCGFQSGRPRPSPVVRLFSFLIEKSRAPAAIEMNGRRVECVAAEQAPTVPVVRPAAPPAPSPGAAALVPLVDLAWGRSGDKGNTANVAIIARHPDYLPFIYAALSIAVVRDRFEHFLAPGADVERFYLPGSHALNFVLHDVLGGGGIASLRSDPQAKGYAQLLLDVPVAVSEGIAAGLASVRDGAGS